MDGLVLFDIDATLLLTDGAGMGAMEDAGRELFGPGFTAKGVDFAGRLDPLLFRELLAVNGCGESPEVLARLRAGYRGHLERRLAAATRARALPGVPALVAAVRDSASHETGVLTGNFRETGMMKLAKCGLAPEWFRVCAWGDDSPHEPPDREHLPRVAMGRFLERHGRAVEASRVTIIGDTPHDVRCARANGCRCIGVATGRYTEEELRGAGADAVVRDLSNTGALVEMIGVRAR